MIDMEHGAFDLETIANLAAWFSATEASPIVRIHKAFIHLIPGILDQGIMGIQISGVDNAAEARAIVQEAKYPPIGNRSVGGSLHALNFAATAGEYYATANDEILVILQTESPLGVQHAEEIYSLTGVDAIYGPTETMVIADEGADPVLAAADLLAQAEHDVLASPILLTDSPVMAERVAAEEQTLRDAMRHDPNAKIGNWSLANGERLGDRPEFVSMLIELAEGR